RLKKVELGRSPMPRIKSEQETTITFNEEEADMLVWTASPRFRRWMVQVGIEPYKIDRGHLGADESEDSCWYHIPKEWLRIRPRRSLSDAERARLREKGFQETQDHKGQPQRKKNAKFARPASTHSKSVSDPRQQRRPQSLKDICKRKRA